MLWIGLTGGIASGKSTVAKFLRELGYPVVEADLLAHKAYEKGTKGHSLLIQYFGSEIVSNSGDVDRKALGQAVFSQPEKLKKLEEIIHPLVQELALKEKTDLEAKGFAMAFYEVPLLFEKKLESKFDLIVAVASSLEQQLKRLKTRNGMSEAEGQLRLKNQLPLEEKVKRAHYVIENSGHEADLKLEVEKMIEFCLNHVTAHQAQE